MGLTKQIFKHTAIYSFATVLGRLISFIMLPFYAHIFQTEGYGVIGMVDASLGFLSILFAAGFHVAILKIYHEETEARKRLVISTAIRLVWALGLAAIIIPAIFSSQLSGFILGSKDYSLVLVLALISFVIDVAGQSASTFLIIEQKSILYSVVGIVRLLIGVALNIWLVIILQVGVIGVFITSLVAAAVSSFIFHFAAIRAHGLAYNASVARKLIKFQGPLMPGEFVAYLSRQAERFIVKFLIDIKAVGILEMAYKFPPLLNLFVTFPFMSAWRSKAFEIAKQDDAPDIIGKMFTNYFSLMAFVGMLIAISIDDILKITTPPDFWAAAIITKIEVMTTIVAGVNSYVIFGMMYRDKTTEISVLKIVLAVVKILLGLFFVSSFKLYGAAFSALIVEVVMLTVLFNKSQKYYRIRYEYRKLLFLTSYCFAIYLLIDTNTMDNISSFLIVKFKSIEFIMNTWQFVLSLSSNKLIGVIVDKIDYIISLGFNFMMSSILLFAVPILLIKVKRSPSSIVRT